MKSNNYDYSYWIGMISGVLGIISCLLPIISSHNYNLSIAIFIIGALSACVVFENIHLKKNWRRRKRYPGAIKYLNRANAILNRIGEGTSQIDSQTFKSEIIKVCNCLSEFFSEVTGKICSVSLKKLTGNPYTDPLEIVEVETYCRDEKSQSIRANSRHLTRPNIENNSDFKKVIVNLRNDGLQERHFISNNLVKDFLKGYKNSRFSDDFYRIINDANNNSEKFIDRFWPLSYLSTVVVAIFPLNPEKKYDLFCFLCIDANEKDVFLEEYDVEVLYGLADCLYKYSNRFQN